MVAAEAERLNASVETARPFVPNSHKPAPEELGVTDQSASTGVNKRCLATASTGGYLGRWLPRCQRHQHGPGIMLPESSQSFILRNAEPLCRAMWSVLSLSISYCGSASLAWWVYPL